MRLTNELFVARLLELEQEIIANEGDDEAQHDTEDRMLRYFVNNCLDVESDQLEEGRSIILRVREMDFQRYCA